MPDTGPIVPHGTYPALTDHNSHHILVRDKFQSDMQIHPTMLSIHRFEKYVIDILAKLFGLTMTKLSPFDYELFLLWRHYLDSCFIQMMTLTIQGLDKKPRRHLCRAAPSSASWCASCLDTRAVNYHQASSGGGLITVSYAILG